MALASFAPSAVRADVAAPEFSRAACPCADRLAARPNGLHRSNPGSGSPVGTEHLFRCVGGAFLNGWIPEFRAACFDRSALSAHARQPPRMSCLIRPVIELIWEAIDQHDDRSRRHDWLERNRASVAVHPQGSGQVYGATAPA